MEIYLAYSEKGICECYEQNGVYFPLHQEDMKKFYGVPIISVELKTNEEI